MMFRHHFGWLQCCAVDDDSRTAISLSSSRICLQDIHKPGLASPSDGCSSEDIIQLSSKDNTDVSGVTSPNHWGYSLSGSYGVTLPDLNFSRFTTSVFMFHTSSWLTTRLVINQLMFRLLRSILLHFIFASSQHSLSVALSVLY